MGSNGSRRRLAMDDDSSNSVGEDSDDGLPEFLAYLMRSRSGQLGLYLSRHMEGGDSGCEDDDLQFYGMAKPPTVSEKPDTTTINESDLMNEILLKSGRRIINTRPCTASVAHMLHLREVGMKFKNQFSRGDCCVMTTPYIPNYMEKLASYEQKAFCGTYSKDGSIFLTASQDQFLRIYDTSNDKFKFMKSVLARDVGWSVLDTAFSPDGNYLVYSSWSECIHLCNIYGDMETHTPLHLFPGERSFCIFSVTFSSDNKEILGGANDGCMYVYDRERNQRTLKIDAHQDDVNAVAFADSSSNILFSGGDDGLCKVWDRRTLREENPIPIGILAGHTDGITYIDTKNDSRYLISNSKDQSIKLWDIRHCSSSNATKATKKAVSMQRWDYRWQQVPRKVANRKRLDGDSSIQTYHGHCILHTLIRCRFSPEFTTGQRYIYTGCATGNVVVYDLLTGEIVTKLHGQNSCVRDVSWHPFENHIISTSWDGTLGKWRYRPSLEDSDGAMSDSNEDNDDDEQRNRPRRSRRVKKQKMHLQRCQSAPCRKLFD